ncbi:flagellar motor switch protein FliN [Nocardioides sp. zg-1228]|uniref:flagellar motor switch protein FliN n=1 Tax=Nocardioides sp. zg-1228 TaxID=2763008 RepID=UPI00164264BE|nr:flagellar motor switch protein FliN [Nocardioides sp. zg-1228]MBC2932339.1 flagellar motor switch protein FliN [Nocardioides sp. zg-1228]QSF57855.1 flagellar motor switch protein FliN [Nocardioides sp. zg-1228]
MSTLTVPTAEQALGPVTAAAAAAAGVLPAPTALVAGTPAPGGPDAAAGFAGAVVADLHLPGAPRIAVLVGADLVDALAASPLGGLDLAAATQPALDAAAAALGTGCGAAREVATELVGSDVAGPATAVPLLGGGVPCGALLVPDAVIATAGALAPGVASAAPEEAIALPASRGIEMLYGVDLEVAVELGRTRMTVRELLALSPGDVLELDRAAGGPADLLVNGRLIARGEVVIVDEDFGLRITEIVDDSAAG